MIRRGFRSVIVLAALALLGGCAEFYRPAEGPVGEAHRPRLEAAWAQAQIGYGAQWRIYVRATDPDGDLDRVWITFTRFGGTYPGTFVYLPGDPRREVNGYIQMWAVPRGGMHFGQMDIHATAEVRVEDRAGNMSAPRSFPFTLVLLRVPDKGEPPAGFAREARLAEMGMTMEIDLGAGDDRGSGM
ncbi:MAG: hypothetical protein AABZ64_06045 [Nitrospinota bacterium]